MFSEFGMLSIILCLAGDIVNRQSAYFFIVVAVFYYQSSSAGFLISRNISQLCILQLAFQLNIFAVSYIKSNFAVCTDAAAVNELILRLNGLNQLAFIKCYGVVMVSFVIRHITNSYVTIAVILNGSNGVGVILLNKIAQLLAINAKLICMIAVCTFIFNRQDIGINSYCSNGVGVNNTGFNLRTIFAYQRICINYCALTCSCRYLFNNLIL